MSASATVVGRVAYLLLDVAYYIGAGTRIFFNILANEIEKKLTVGLGYHLFLVLKTKKYTTWGSNVRQSRGASGGIIR